MTHPTERSRILEQKEKRLEERKEFYEANPVGSAPHLGEGV